MAIMRYNRAVTYKRSFRKWLFQKFIKKFENEPKGFRLWREWKIAPKDAFQHILVDLNERARNS